MRLTMQDKNEFLKAAFKATDLGDLKRWLVGIVDALDAEAAAGEADIHMAVPPYVAPGVSEHSPACPSSLVEVAEPWQNGQLLVSLPNRDKGRGVKVLLLHAPTFTLTV